MGTIKQIKIMTETTLQFVEASKLTWLSGYALLYGLGGIFGKWKRRFLASFWLTLGIYLYSGLDGEWNNYTYLSIFPFLIGASSLGYGADQLIKKLQKRVLAGSAFGFVPIAIAIDQHAWILFSVHFTLCITMMTIMGIFNPFKSARKEETFLGAIFGCLPLYMI